MNIAIVTQARISSSRLPAKVLREVAHRPLLDIHLRRAKLSTLATHFIVATTLETKASNITSIALNAGWDVFQGSLDNVLDRFYHALTPIHPEWVVRITSDCPLIDPVLIDEVIDRSIQLDLDYCSTTLGSLSYPDGTDVEVFKFEALKIAYQRASSKSELEHVTPYIIKHSQYMGGSMFKAMPHHYPINYSHIRITVDTPRDFILIDQLVHRLGTDKPWLDYACAVHNSPFLYSINKQYG